MSLERSKSTSRTRSLTPILGQVSPGPTPAANPGMVTTLGSIRDTGADILSMIEGIHKKRKSPTAEALATMLQSRLAALPPSLESHEEIDEPMRFNLGPVATTLQEIRSALKAQNTLRKRDKAKIGINRLLGVDAGVKESDPYVSWQLELEVAFQTLELQLKLAESHPPTTTPAIATPRPSDTPSTHQVEGPNDNIPHISKRTGRYHTAIDAVEKTFQVTLAIAEVIPPPGGGIVKAISGVTLSIITTLKGVESNNEDVIALAGHLGGLFRTIVQFLCDDGGLIREVTQDQLKLFQAELEAVEKELKSLSNQGKTNKVVSHARNKEALASCDARIRRAFAQLQTYLSLDAARMLTRLEDAGARREAARLLDLLGDLDTGARDKADDPADLACLPGTRVELLEDVRQWIANGESERVLWVNGVAGCGKSAVAATIASQNDGLSASAIFHFSRGNQGRNDRVICCLARQLARWNHGSLEPLVLASVQKNPDIASSHFTAQFQNLIVEPLKKIVPGTPPVLIVIDALDEWDKRDSAVRLVDLIRRWNADLPRSIKFVFTSRKESHFNMAFDDPRVKDLVLRHSLDTDTSTQHAHRDIEAYLKKRFSDIQLSTPEPIGASWPGDDAVKDLVKLSGGLFQWASTAVEYVKEPRHQARLADIRAHPNELGDLDQLYQHILQSLFQKRTRPTTLQLLQVVLGLIVVAPTPITLNTIVFLLADHKESTSNKLEEVRDEILGMLGAFLIIPTDPDQPIRVLHPSIIDYLTDPQRCTDLRFYIESIPHNQSTATLCFRRMHHDLKRDICGTNDPTKFNAEIQDAVSEHVSEPLRYVCRHWAHYLTASGEVPPRKMLELVNHFCNKLVLFWIEVISLTGTVHQAVASIRAVEEWARKISSDIIYPDIQQLLHDTSRFLLAYSEPISTSAQHIYISALSFTPTETLFGRTYQGSTISGPRVLLGPVGKHWPASLWVAARHSAAVTCIAFSSDGETIVSGALDATLRLWNPETGMQRGGALESHSAWVNCLALSSDGKTIISSSLDSTLYLWDAETGLRKGAALEGHSDVVTCVGFSSDGSTAVSGSCDMTLRLWDVETGMQRGGALEGHTSMVTCVGFTLDGKTVVSGSEDATLRIWDVETGVQRGDALKGHSSKVACMALSINGKTIVSGSSDSSLRLWDIEKGTRKGDALTGHSGTVTCVGFTSDGKTVVSGSEDATLRLWDVETGVQRGDALRGHSGKVMCMALSINGKTVVSGSADSSLRLWDIERGMQKGDTLTGHSGTVTCVGFASDGQMVVSGSADKTLRLWDTETGVQRADTLEGRSMEVDCAELSSDGRAVASGLGDKTLPFGNIEPAMQRGGALEGHSAWVNCLTFSTDGKMVASGSDDTTLRLWDVEAGMQRAKALEGHSLGVNFAGFSSDGKILVSGSHDMTLRLWDVETGVLRHKPLEICFQPVSLAFSSDGQQLEVTGVDFFDNDEVYHQHWDLPTRDCSPDNQATSSPAQGPAVGLVPVELEISYDGWVCYEDRRWFWVPPTFGRGIMGSLLGDRFVFSHDRHVCIINVLEVLYIVN